MSEQTGKVFILRGQEIGRGKYWMIAILITDLPYDWRYITGAWNYAIRKTAKELLNPDYSKALQWLLDHHPTWNITVDKTVREANFDHNRHYMDQYKPPSDE